MKILLKETVKALGKVGLIDVFFPTITKIAKVLLPKEGMVNVGRCRMLIEPRKSFSSTEKEHRTQ